MPHPGGDAYTGGDCACVCGAALKWEECCNGALWGVYMCVAGTGDGRLARVRMMCASASRSTRAKRPLGDAGLHTSAAA